MKIGDLVIAAEIRHRVIIVQRKTGKPVQFELMRDARESLLASLERRGGALDYYVFPSRIDHACQARSESSDWEALRSGSPFRTLRRLQ